MLTFWLLLLFLGVRYGAAMEPGCLSLTRSQECQAFQDYSIDVWNGPLWLRNSSSVEEVDDRLGGYLQQQHLACGAPPRYATTVLCAQMVQSSLGCNSVYPSLCDDTCADATAPIVSCYAPSYQQTCNVRNDTLPTLTTTCIHGYDNDQYCGWTNETAGCSFCQAKPNDPCCTTLHNPCSSHQPTRIIGAVLGSVFGCLAILGCVWCWWRQRRRRRRRQQLDSNYEKGDPAAVYISNNSTTSTLICHQTTSLKVEDEKETRHSSETATLAAAPLTFTLAKRHDDDYCFYQAIYVNVPCRPYDVLLNKGDIVHLHCYTDEDWGIGYNVSTGQQGSFPMICIHSITLEQVWELVKAHPVDQQRSLLKHRVSYFMSSNQHPLGNHDDGDDRNDVDNEPTSNMIPTSAIPPTPSSDDDSPITPPPATLLNRALGYNNHSHRTKRGSGTPFQLYYQPITSTHHL